MPKKSGTRFIKWIVILAVLGGAGYYFWQQYQRKQATAGRPQFQTAKIEKELFPLTVLRIDDFVAPQVTGKDTFRPGRARAMVFFFEAPDAACTLTISTTSDKSVSALALDGNTGGDEVVNARLANDLEQSVQRAAGMKLTELGRVGALEPVIPGKSP